MTPVALEKPFSAVTIKGRNTCMGESHGPRATRRRVAAEPHSLVHAVAWCSNRRPERSRGDRNQRNVARKGREQCHVGFIRLLLLWLIGGSIATLISTLFVMPPWNPGTGASQAIVAIAGAGIWLALTGVDRSKSLILPVAFKIAAALTIDLIHVHYPKPGHAAGVLLGLLIPKDGKVSVGLMECPPRVGRHRRQPARAE
jgi:hypothetical protein